MKKLISIYFLIFFACSLKAQVNNKQKLNELRSVKR